MNGLRHFILSVTCLVASAAFAADSPEAAIRAAHDLLSKGDVNGAIARYEEARSVDPESPELAYNLGVAMYRAGKFTDAAALFKEAASKAKADLAAKAMFNQGTSVYADALAKVPDKNAPEHINLQTPGQQPDAPDPLDEAIAAVEESVTHFKDAMAADPSDGDSRANAERAWRLLKQLREEKKKQEEQQQQQQQQQQQNQDQKDQDKQQNQQDQKQQNQPNKDEGKQDERKPEDEKRNQSKSDQQQKDQGQQHEQDQKDKQKNGEQKDDQKKDDKKAQQGKPQAQQSQGSPDSKQGDSKQQQQAKPTMSREDAERLLQIARDKEKERRELKAQKDRARQEPVKKDW